MLSRPLTILLLMLAACSAAPAQYVGIAGRYGIGLVEGGRLTDQWRSWCGCDETGSALAQQTLVSASFLFEDDDAPIAAGARLGVGSSLWRFVSPTYPSTRTDLPSNALLEYRESLRSMTIRLDLEGRYAATDVASLVAGPWFEYTVDSKVDRIERIASPSEGSFPGEGSERSLAAEPVVAHEPLRWGISLGLSMSLEVSPGVQVVPHVVLDGDLQGLGAARPGALMLGAGTAVVIDTRGGKAQASRPLAEVPLELPPIDLPVDTPRVTPPAAPSASLALYAHNGSARAETAIARRDLVYRRVVAQLPRTLALDTSALAMRERFALENLVGADRAMIERRLLDVVGLRMSERRRARLRIVATMGEDEAPATARARAWRVREHLAARWSIERSRIAIAAEPMADGDSVVTLQLQGGELLDDPLIVEWLDERFSLPVIEIDPTIAAPAGLRSARLRLSRRGHLLAEAPIEGATSLRELAVDLSDAVAGDAPAPIVAELEITDSIGRVARAGDHLTLAVPAGDSAEAADRERITVSLSECATPARRADHRLCDELRRSVRQGARARVSMPRSATASTDATLEKLREVLREKGAMIEESRWERGYVEIEIEQGR